MALQNLEIFPNNTPSELEDFGWGFSNTSGLTVQSTTAYDYPGSPTRYALEVTASGTRVCTCPAAAYPTTGEGWIAIAVKSDSAVHHGSSNTWLIEVEGAATARSTGIRYASGGKSLNLYVDNTFKESTAAIDWDSWRYVALRLVQNNATWEGRIYVDGAAATSNQTESRSVDTAGTVDIGVREDGAGNSFYVAQVATWNSTSDPGEVPRYLTAVNPNADGTDVGTWSPSAGSDDYAVVDLPLSASTYSRNSSPSGSDRLQVLTNDSGADLDSLLGTTVTNIDGIQLKTWSAGQGLTAKATIGDGSNETSGSNEVIHSTNPTLAQVMATTTPTGPDWAGSDQPEFNYDIVSV